MSYDILAFEPDAVSDADFMAWWAVQSEWEEDHDYDDPAITTPRLRAFYADLTVQYPPMNGPGAPDEDALDDDPDLEARVTDYSIGTQLIYAAFAWSQAESARTLFCQLARKHGVAVALVSDGFDNSIIHRP